MRQIDEARLESDLAYRFSYLADFVAFTNDDIEAIHGAAPHLSPLVTPLVDAVYEKLFSYDATKRHFVPRQYGYQGEPPEDLESLTFDHEVIRFRKQHLADYWKRLLNAAYDGKMVAYLDMVGKIHTPHAGSAHVSVPLVQMNALMGFVSDAVIAAICGLGLDADTTMRTVRAFNKLFWLQNDLITRHYRTLDDREATEWASPTTLL